MHQSYLNAMTIVQPRGKTNLFITVTCNPKWTEIADLSMPTETAGDQPDLTARVFKMKFDYIFFRHQLIYPNWIDITDILSWTATAGDRPGLTARALKIKLLDYIFF